MRNRLLYLILLIALSWGAASCAGRQFPEPADAITSHTELLAHMENRSKDVRSARARAVMEYFSRTERVRVRQALVIERPHNLRLETLSPFDTTLSVVVANFRDITLYDLNADAAWVGAPTADNLAALIPLRFTPSDIVSVLLGSPPLDRMNAERGVWKVGWDARRGSWRMFVPAGDGSQLEIFVRHGSWVVSGARELDRHGKVQWEVRTADFKTVSDGTLETEIPTRVRFLMNREGLDVSLTVSDYELNPEVMPEVFELDLEGVPITTLDAPPLAP